MKKEILLSISVMVSGREETMKKCIASLEHLRQHVPSELILTDTGCTGNQRAWLEERADKVISFAWCNDFAAARNAGLQEASGSWFMFLDDDEWFEDTSAIEGFFQSGEYRQYCTALYKVRNYADRTGTKWRDTYLARMVRISEDTRFIFPIHETLAPAASPCKYLEDYVHHYGYAYASREEETAKHERNITLLEEAIIKEGHCMHHYMQLMIEYTAMKDYAKALETARAGIGRYNGSCMGDDKFVQALYAGSVRYLVNTGAYGEACREASGRIQCDSISPLAVAVICGDVSIACLKTGQYEKGCGYVEQYLVLKAAFEKDQKAFQTQQTMLLESCFETEHYRWIMGTGLALAAAAGALGRMEKLLTEEETGWWETALDTWWGKTPEPDREKFISDFEELIHRNRVKLQNTCNHGTKAVLLYEKLKSVRTASRMRRLAGQLKQKIRQLAAAGEREGALAAIVQLKSYFPEDKELQELENQLHT